MLEASEGRLSPSRSLLATFRYKIQPYRGSQRKFSTLKQIVQNSAAESSKVTFLGLHSDFTRAQHSPSSSPSSQTPMSFPFALPGYSYDPIRKKYFSTPTPSSAPTQAPSFSAGPSASSLSSSSSSRHGGGGPGPSKRARSDEYGISYKGKEKEVAPESRWDAFSRMQRGGGSSANSRANRR